MTRGFEESGQLRIAVGIDTGFSPISEVGR
jgi:hypothetical protein